MIVLFTTLVDKRVKGRIVDIQILAGKVREWGKCT